MFHKVTHLSYETTIFRGQPNRAITVQMVSNQSHQLMLEFLTFFMNPIPNFPLSFGNMKITGHDTVADH